MADFQIRETRLTDAEGIAKVHVRTWQSAYSGLVPDSYLQSLTVELRTITWIRNIENALPKTRIFVAEFGNQIVGFLSVGANREIGPTSEGEIFAIYVDPEFQGQGIGSALMSAGAQRLRNDGFTTAILWVLHDNLPTRSWYESHGWKADGESKLDRRHDFILTEVRYGIELLPRN